MKILLKNLFILFFILFSFSTTLAGDRGYKEMKEEYQSYKAPLFYEQSVSGHPKGSVEKIEEEDIGESDLKITEEDLEEEKQRWDAVIARISNNQDFFDFESSASRRIREIAKTEKIKKRLKQGIGPVSLVAAAFERNPGLESAKKKWSAALEKYSQATRLDNILRQYQAFVKDLNTKVGPMRHKQTMSQKFPFPGMLTLKGDIVTKEVELAREKYLITLRDLIAGIKNTYYELMYNDHAIHITSENLDLLKQLEGVAYIKYKAGQAGYSDVIKVQTRIAKLDDDLITWRENRNTVAAKLNEFLNLPPQFPLGPPQKVDLRDTGLSFLELMELGIQHQQELKIIQLKIDKTNLAIELAEKKFYPDFTLGFSYLEDEKGNIVGVGKEREPFSLKPVSKTPFWFGKNDAYIREARQVYQSLIEDLKSGKNKLGYMVKNIFFQLDTAKRDVLLYKETLLQLAQSNLDVSQTDYQAGKADFLDVLDAQKTWLDYNLLYKQHVRHQNQSIANMERAIGKRLAN